VVRGSEKNRLSLVVCRLSCIFEKNRLSGEPVIVCRESVVNIGHVSLKIGYKVP